MLSVPVSPVSISQDYTDEDPDARGGGQKGKDRRTEREGELYEHDGY